MKTASLPSYEKVEQDDSARLPYIRFFGKESESSGDLIQAITRVAFERGRIDDDRWIVGYASTCLNGEALVWYCNLEEDIQKSWKKLRNCLVERYPPTHSPTHIDDVEVVAPYMQLEAFMSPQAKLQEDSNKCQEGVKGVIEIVNKPEAKAYTYAGLTLVKTDSRKPDVVPNEVEEAKCDSTHYQPPMYYGVPGLSPRCVAYAEGHFGIDLSKELATWTLCLCDESKSGALDRRRANTSAPGRRAAAAVWKYDAETEELSLTWLMDNDEECELAAYMHKDDLNTLHVHRLCDMDRVGKYFDEDRVVSKYSGESLPRR
ncbi:hypothetical protein FRB90_005282 [Tulasnella sp. 427]|nr:hypothetical protein FRB90_005282 [Tulasnella sp. 427]